MAVVQRTSAGFPTSSGYLPGEDTRTAEQALTDPRPGQPYPGPVATGAPHLPLVPVALIVGGLLGLDVLRHRAQHRRR